MQCQQTRFSEIKHLFVLGATTRLALVCWHLQCLGYGEPDHRVASGGRRPRERFKTHARRQVDPRLGVMANIDTLYGAARLAERFVVCPCKTDPLYTIMELLAQPDIRSR